MTIDELKAAKWQADRELSALRTKRRNLESERRTAFEEHLRRELDGVFGGPIAEASATLKAAEDAYDRAVEAEALAKPRKIPLGTVMEEWKYPRNNFDRGPRRATGRRGVLEVVTAASELPARGYPPAIGTEIIRLLKKDGAPSKQYVSGWAVTNEWRPEAKP